METSSALHDELRHIVGEAGILPTEQTSDYTFDGCVPKAVVSPASVQEMQAVLRLAKAEQFSVIPAGAGTKLGIGNLPAKVDIVLVTTRLNSVVEYEPADLTVTVEAGIRLADLQAELARHRQFLALNPPYADSCTVGGLVATNSSGSVRLRYGTARNQVLGMRVILANGTVVKSGGKVVKNVAGYDLNKLYIGAFGTLGIITEVALKLAPLPARRAILAAQFQGVQAAIGAGLSVLRSQALPTFVNLFMNANIDCFTGTKPVLIVGFGGDAETVTWQLDHAQTLMEQNSTIGVEIVEGELQENLNQTVQKFPEANRHSDAVIAKVNLKRTDIVEFVEKHLNSGGEMMALLGSGVLYLKTSIDSGTDLQALAATLTQLRQHAMAVQGNLIITAAPPELKQHIDAWGPIGSTLRLMEQVKAKFDADGLLNPGRFVSNP